VTEVFVGIGSNVEPERHVRQAVALLREQFGPVQLSPVYRNRAVGFEGDDFLNLVTCFGTRLGVAELNTALDGIEVRCGRERSARKFSPRTLDLDLLLYGDTVSEKPVRLPRREILKYAFVLKPLADIAAGRRHPETGRSYAEHWADFSGEGAALARVELAGL